MYAKNVACFGEETRGGDDREGRVEKGGKVTSGAPPGGRELGTNGLGSYSVRRGRGPEWGGRATLCGIDEVAEGQLQRATD